jgi:hypothetical protein
MATTPSSAEAFFQQIFNDADPVAFVRNLVAEQTPEEEWLEFKSGKNPKTNGAIPDSDVEKYWSKTVSGFANTGGGVLLWGIDARQDPATRIDGAGALLHVPDPAAFKTRLTRLLQHATDPPVTGIAIKELSDLAEPGEGFVVCLVPESSFKPHRAERCEGKPYYVRIMDRFEYVPHSLLRHMFFPEHHSRFELQAGINWSVDEGYIHILVDGGLKNIGTKTAKNLLVQVRTEPKLGLVGKGPFQSSFSLPPAFDFEAKRPIHPDRFDQMFTAGLQVPSRRSFRNADHWSVPDVDHLTFHFRLFAADEECQSCELHFDSEEIEFKRSKTVVAEPKTDGLQQYKP